MALSKLNNWNAPLAAFGFPGDVFTGRPEATSGAAISVNIIASTHCTLTIEQSYNTTNWYYSNHLDISAGQLLTLQVPVVMPNFRVNVLNEEQVTQTYFNMNTSLVPQLTQNFNIRHLTAETDSVAVDLSGVTLEVGTTINVGNFPALQFTYDASACSLLTDAVAVLTDISNNPLVLPPVLDISGSVFVSNFPTLQDTYDASANVLLAEVVAVLTDISNNGLILPPVLDISGSVFVSNFPTLQDTYDASANALLTEAIAVLTDISNNVITLPPVLDISGSVLANAIDIALKSQVPLSSFALDGGVFGIINQLFTYVTAADPSGNPASSILACGIDDTAVDSGVRPLPLTNPYIAPITYKPYVRSYIQATDKVYYTQEGSSAVSYGRGKNSEGDDYQYLPLTLAPNRNIVDVSANELYVKDIDVTTAVNTVVDTLDSVIVTKSALSVSDLTITSPPINYKVVSVGNTDWRVLSSSLQPTGAIDVVNMISQTRYVVSATFSDAQRNYGWDTINYGGGGATRNNTGYTFIYNGASLPPAMPTTFPLTDTQFHDAGWSYTPTAAPVFGADPSDYFSITITSNQATFLYEYSNPVFGGPWTQSGGTGLWRIPGSYFNGVTGNQCLIFIDFSNPSALEISIGGNQEGATDPIMNFFQSSVLVGQVFPATEVGTGTGTAVEENANSVNVSGTVTAVLTGSVNVATIGTGYNTIGGTYLQAKNPDGVIRDLSLLNHFPPQFGGKNVNALYVNGFAYGDVEQTGETNSSVSYGKDGSGVIKAMPLTTGGAEVKTSITQALPAGEESIGSTVCEGILASDNTTVVQIGAVPMYSNYASDVKPTIGLAVYTNAFQPDDSASLNSSIVTAGKITSNGNYQYMQLDDSLNLKTVINAALPAGSNAIGNVGLTASLNTATYNQAVSAGGFNGTTYTVGENSLVDVLLLATGTIISGTVRLEYSIDGTNWFPNNTTNYTISTADPHQTIIGLRTGSQYIRIGSVSTSTFRATNLQMTYSSKRN